MEVMLTDFGIAGKILRIQNYTDSKAIIEDEIKRGAKTVVIVGNDATFGQVLSRSATCDCTFGFLPIGSNNTIAEVLGIPIGLGACAVLSRRRKELLDIGWMNNRYFVSQLHVLPAKIDVIYDERFKASANGKMEVVVCNLQPFFWKQDKKDKENRIVHPQDGKLEAFLRPLTKKRWWGYKYEEPSIFPFEEMIIIAKEPFTIEADGKISKEIKRKIGRGKRTKIKITIKSKKAKVYFANKHFTLFTELQNLVTKSSVASKKEITNKIRTLGNVKLALVSGVFTNNENARTDLLIVGDRIKPGKINSFLSKIESDIGKSIHYTLMDTSEFKYRMDMYDRFLRDILEFPHEKLINKVNI